MGLSVTVQPGVEPVSVAQAKRHLNVDHSEDDTYISTVIEAARQWCEQRTRRAFITQTQALTLQRFPISGFPICLPNPPLISITSVSYIDTDEVVQTWDASNYSARVDSLPGELRPGYNVLYPNAINTYNAVTVTFTCGYGTSGSDVPAFIRQAILILIAEMYENRENSVVGTTTSPAGITVERLLHGAQLYNPITIS